jgi:nucleoside-diphosphate-sugar epimerase
LPDQVYNLGSKDPPTVSELLEELIRRARSKSVVLKTPARLVKGLLALLDLSGLTVLHKEQFAIADVNYLVDIEKTEKELDWHPNHTDKDMLFEAFDQYLADSNRASG